MLVSVLALRCIKAFLLSSIITSAFITLAILQGPSQVLPWTANRPPNLYGNVISKARVFPQGDDIPKPQPWTTPSPKIYNRTADLVGFDGPYITANFSFSPGLGNLMFQYAALYSFARASNAKILIPHNFLLRRAFSLNNTVIVDAVLLDRLTRLPRWKRQYARDCCRYYPEVVEWIRANVSLDGSDRVILFGYFQSWKYFEHIKPVILAEFTFFAAIQEAAFTLIRDSLELSKADPNNITLVGVHVRHGIDMTWNSRNLEHGHKVAPIRYYVRAMEMFRELYPNSFFLIFSDDVYWARQNLVGPGIVHANSGIREVDMCALTLTDHIIMSQGTYSWWAAYLTGGDVIYYSGWPRYGSKLAHMTEKQDFFYQGWVGTDGL